MSNQARMIVSLILCAMLLGTLGPVVASPLTQGDAGPILVAARTDLESLANETLGDAVRPAGWTQDYDVQGQAFVINLRLDLETLAGHSLGVDVRPSGWFGASPGGQWAIARDVRHDLELLADAVLGAGQRPAVWVGGDPLMACDRDVQATVSWLRATSSLFEVSVFAEGANYCSEVAQEANLFVDVLVPEPLPSGKLRADLDLLYAAVVDSNLIPQDWSESEDIAEVRRDLETLRVAAARSGAEVDDSRWFGTLFGTDWVIALGLRHDLEVLADAALGFNERPVGWSYFNALVRCSRTTQALARLIQPEGLVFSTDPVRPEYCAEVAAQTSGYVETRVQNGEGGRLVVVEPDTVARVFTLGNLAGFADAPAMYLDPAATIRVGGMPRGVRFAALARNGGEDSNMMLVEGEGFVVWVAWPWTSVVEEQYLALPVAVDVRNQLPQLLCFAYFCESIIQNGDPILGGVLPR